LVSVNFPFLFIEDDESYRGLLEDFFSRKNVPFWFFSNGLDGLRKFIDRKDSIVYVSYGIKDLEPFSFVKKLRGIRSDVYVVLGIDKFDEKIVTKALNSGVVRFVKKPYTIDDINRVYNELNESFLESHRRDFALRFLYSEERIFVMDNSLDDILPITMEIVRGIQYVLGEYGNVDDLMVSITEVLRNAIEHGNLGITYEEKQEAVLSGNYERLLEERSKDEKYRNRKIYIHYKLDEDKVMIRIRDEGDGFDWKKMYRKLKRTTKHSHKPTGRGLIIVKMGIDKVYFNDKGNEVTLIKYIKRNNSLPKIKGKELEEFIRRGYEIEAR